MRTLRRIAAGASALLIVWLGISTPSYGMLGFGIFSVILSTIQNSIGVPASDLQKIEEAQNVFNQATIWPQSLVDNYRNFASQISSVYRPWMNQVYSLPVSSATVGNDISFESLLQSGNSNNLGQLSQSYNTVYGPIPTNTDASTPYQEQTDALDSAAMASDGLSVKADQSATALLSQSQALSDQAQSTAQGTATMVAAEAEALQLESLAIQHAELAAMLRTEATRVASTGSTLKQESIIGNANARVTNNILNINPGGN